MGTVTAGITARSARRLASGLGAAALAVAGMLAAATPAASAAGLRGTQAGPTGAEDALVGVSCPATSDCFAVGFWGRGAGSTAPSQHALLEQWKGSAWQVVSAPAPKAAFATQLTGISCPSVASCMATGLVESNAGGIEPYFLSWNGTTWTLVASPGSTVGEGAMLSGISCITASNCLAVGENLAADGVLRAELLNGSKWSVLSVPAPAHAGGAAFSGVSCTSASNCVAVGTYFIGGLQLPLGETWNGKAWAVHNTPGTNDADFSGVACPSAGECLAVGTNLGVASAAEWNGKVWTALAAKEPSATSGRLSAVACTSQYDCIAVGQSTSTNIADPVNAPFAETWNGKAWTLTPPIVPAGGSAGFSGVAVVSPAAQIAVGGAGSLTAGGSLTLSELLSTKWSVLPSGNP